MDILNKQQTIAVNIAPVSSMVFELKEKIKEEKGGIEEISEIYN